MTICGKLRLSKRHRERAEIVTWLIKVRAILAKELGCSARPWFRIRA